MERVLVTGATSGLGQAIAEEFLDAGCEVYFHGRDPKNIEASLKHPHAEFISCDLRKINEIQKLVTLITQKAITCVVNNAGIYTDLGDEIPSGLCSDLLTINLLSPILLLKDVYTYYKKVGGGTIVNINSLAGLYPNFKEAVYCASKYGLKGFTDSLHLDAYKHKIRVFDYYPGALKTRMTKSRAEQESLIDPKEVAAQVVSDVMQPRTFSVVRQELRKVSK